MHFYRLKDNSEDDDGGTNEDRNECNIGNAENPTITKTPNIDWSDAGEGQSSILMHVPDIRRNKITSDKNINKSEDVESYTMSTKTLNKEMDEVTRALERNVAVKVILPPTKEENSRCKGN